MDFSSNVFRMKAPSTLSEDTISHTKLVQACRFGWSASDDASASTSTPAPAPVRAPLTTSHIDIRAKRLTPCRGRLYHQLTCSHRIRTDLPEDCGPNCLDPHGATIETPFYCQECVDKESSNIWKIREANLNALFPPVAQMSQEGYNAWYEQRRQLEAELARDRKAYEMQLRATTRPTNIASALEMSKEEADFANELDSLSLSLMSSNEGPSTHQSSHRHRVSLPNDASEQLHWGLNSLSIDRGSCGMEYSGAKYSEARDVKADARAKVDPRQR